MPAAPTHHPQCVLVTGGAGFIGSNFLLKMVPRYPDVRFINVDKLTYAGNLLNLQSIEDAPNYVFVRADIADRNAVLRLFDRYRFTTIIHFAAESHVDRSILAPLAFVESNTLGTVVLLEAARRAWGDSSTDRRFFHVSTDEVFGSLGEESCFTLDTPYDPHSPYSASKAAADHFVRAYAHTYGLPVTISNCSNNYGPYQFPEKLIPLVINNALEKRAIPVYGTGQNVRDWLHVEDHCEAIDTMLQYGAAGATYLVGGHGERTNLDLVRLVLDLVDEELGRIPESSRRLITFVSDRPGHDFRYAIDARYIRETLGWQPRYTLNDGLRATVRWYLSHREWLKQVLDASYRTYYETQYANR